MHSIIGITAVLVSPRDKWGIIPTWMFHPNEVSLTMKISQLITTRQWFETYVDGFADEAGKLPSLMRV